MQVPLGAHIAFRMGLIQKEEYSVIWFKQQERQRHRHKEHITGGASLASRRSLRRHRRRGHRCECRSRWPVAAAMTPSSKLRVGAEVASPGGRAERRSCERGSTHYRKDHLLLQGGEGGANTMIFPQCIFATNRVVIGWIWTIPRGLKTGSRGHMSCPFPARGGQTIQKQKHSCQNRIVFASPCERNADNHE